MNKEEILKLLKKKQDRYYRQRKNNSPFNDDDYEANYILILIESLQSQLKSEKQKLDKIKERCYCARVIDKKSGEFYQGQHSVADDILEIIDKEEEK